MDDKKFPENEFTISDILRAEYPVSDEVTNAIEKMATPWQFSAGEIISAQGKVNTNWLFISTGLCRVYTVKGKKEDTVFFGGAGDIFTSFHSIFLCKESVLQLQALTDCKGWKLSHYKYELLQARFPELLKFEIQLLRGQLFAIEHYYHRRALTDSRQRLKQFWEKREGILEVLQPQTISRFIPLRILAQYLGISPQMLSLLRNPKMHKK